MICVVEKIFSQLAGACGARCVRVGMAALALHVTTDEKRDTHEVTFFWQGIPDVSSSDTVRHLQQQESRRWC